MRALAAADVDAVLALWSGLGYYRRARALHQGARDVVEKYGGELPSTVDALREIRGIGAYTAGAVASLAFGARVPIVDGNVMRVYARVFGIDADIKKPATQKTFWSIAASMVPEGRPNAFNEALMELGATVCLPRDPKCLVCPVGAFCIARDTGRQNELPVVSKAKKVPVVHASALVARDAAGAVLLGRRRGDALFGGMWEPPMIEAASPGEALARVLRIAPDAASSGVVTHVLSHRRMEINVVAGVPREPATYPELYEQVALRGGERFRGPYGMSTLARKVLAEAPQRIASAAPARVAKRAPKPSQTLSLPLEAKPVATKKTRKKPTR